MKRASNLTSELKQRLSYGAGEVKDSSMAEAWGCRVHQNMNRQAEDTRTLPEAALRPVKTSARVVLQASWNRDQRSLAAMVGSDPRTPILDARSTK
jgi:hypothetical protein